MTDEEKTTNMEERIAKIEGILEQINERLNHFGERIDRLDEENRADHHHIETDMKMNFRWTVGIILTMWVTIIIAILFA
jgi:C4-type Zn-finger protein